MQRVLGTPSELTPVHDGELNSDDIEASEQPHEPNEDTTDTAADDDGKTAVPRRVRITMKDLKRYGFTGECPRCIDLELGRANSRNNHNEECRDRMYKKCKEESREKYAPSRKRKDW